MPGAGRAAPRVLALPHSFRTDRPPVGDRPAQPADELLQLHGRHPQTVDREGNGPRAGASQQEQVRPFEADGERDEETTGRQHARRLLCRERWHVGPRSAPLYRGPQLVGLETRLNVAGLGGPELLSRGLDGRDKLLACFG